MIHGDVSISNTFPLQCGVFLFYTLEKNDWSYGSYRRHPLSSRVRRHTRSCILQRNCTAQAWYRFCLFFAVHQTENPGHPGRQALAGTHAICEAQAQVYSSVWLFARCITISFSFHAPCWLSGWSISLTYFRDACGGASGWPSAGCKACGRSLRVVAVLHPGFSPHDPNDSFYLQRHEFRTG